MKRWIGIILILVLASGMGSCIFQNDPAKPNSPPIIKSYQPDSTYMYRKVPDTLVFLIRAIDLDGDQLDYRFLIEDEVSSTTNSLVFYADFAGEYHIQGLVYDGSDSVFHNWYVDVRGHDNEPPYINWFLPEQANVACAVGDVLEFHIGVIDDDPASLRYYYTLDSLLLSSTSPNLLHRFMERGDYTLRGIAWDGEYGDTIEWYVGVTGYPDTICPSSIIDLEGEPGEEIGTIRLTWTAPGDDSTYGTASGYILRTSLTPIQSEEDWNDAAGKVGEPEPSPSGSQETMIARNLNPGTYLYATMRAVDDFFNLSPLGKCERILVRGIDIQG
ncbi:MAG: hypothetical protein KAX38_07880, partial [Candidatus Krumholzibacteria bacterium]|nr:hypothetical protein [Candidatus Krumholzibacteria bacterium]